MTRFHTSLLLTGSLLLFAGCGGRTENNTTPPPTNSTTLDMSAMDMGSGPEDMPDSCIGSSCEEMDTPSTCGDGNLDDGEACDDGNQDEGDYCSADCSSETGSCGDGTTQDNEACDDGMNHDSACAYGETSCMVCDSSCQFVDGSTSFCGDGVLQADEGEACDNGEDNADDAECLTDCTRPLPVDIEVSALATHVLMSNGTVFSWGNNELGQLGNGSLEASSTPVQAQGVTNASQLISEEYNACVISPDGELMCWGSGQTGAIGDGTFEDASSPRAISSLSQTKQVSIGNGFVCALLQSKEVYCWGSNNDERLGMLGENQATPTKVDLPGDTLFLASGKYHTCAILDDTSVWCWGKGAGYGGPEGGIFLPREAPELAGASEIFAGEDRAFFIRDDELWGIGYNGSNQRRLHVCCEDKYTEAIKVPDLVNVKTIDSDFRHSCGLANGQVYCWGSSAQGQLSQTPANFVNVTEVEAPLDVAVGRSHSCAIDGQNRVFCWGDNEFGQLGFDGDGGPTPREVTFWP